MNQKADVLIVGGGVTGLSTGLHLKELGVKNVVILERHSIGSGQSGRAAGVLRGTVRHPTVSETQLEGQTFLRSFEARYGIPIQINQTGYMLVATDREREHVNSTFEVANQAGCDLKRIDAEAAAELQPGLGTEEGCTYLFEPGAIYVDPMPATHAFSLAARNLGVRVIEGCEVGNILVQDEKVYGVASAMGNFEAPTILIATSVWGQPQLAKMGIEVPVRPHIAEMGFFQVPLHSRYRLLRVIFDSRAKLYMRPEGELQMFVGRRESDYYQSNGVAIDPDNYKQTANFHSLKEMHKNLQITLPFMSEGFVHRTYACTYDVTPDEMPILDRAESVGGLYFAIGFSGGGFSTSPWVGKRMASFMAEGAKPQDMEVFALERFAKGELIRWSNTSD
jgi:sarcosine oxidase subunit beta